MIFITVSMLAEARPLIEREKLKRIPQETAFPVYRNGPFCLIITGIGGIKAMNAATYLLTRFDAQKTDFLLSVGIGALLRSPEEYDRMRGRIFLARRIDNPAFKRTCYPDLLYSTPFDEADLVTLPWVYRKGEMTGMMLPADPKIPVLADMEAAFVYEAAKVFIHAHHIFLLKIVSDAGGLETGRLTRQTVRDLIEGQMPVITPFIGSLESREPRTEDLLSPEDLVLLEKIRDCLRLTCYQQTELRQLAGLSLRRGRPICGIADILPEEPVNTKKEGKERYERLRKILVEP